MSDVRCYLVGNKEDDYGNGLTEFVQTTPELSKGYYWAKEVDPDDQTTIKKYFGLVEYEEEKTRSNDRRFYGTVEE